MVATNKIWNDISKVLNYRMSSNAIHTFVQLGRHGILDKLGLSKNQESPVTTEPLLDNRNDISTGKGYTYSTFN